MTREFHCADCENHHARKHGQRQGIIARVHYWFLRKLINEGQWEAEPDAFERSYINP